MEVEMMNWTTVTSKFNKKVGKKLLAGVIALAVVGGIGYGGASYYKEMEKAQIREARTQMVMAQAEARNMTLVSNDQVKEAAASAIGQPLDSIQFKQVDLVAFPKPEKDKGPGHEKRDKHEKGDREHKGDKGEQRGDKKPMDGPMNPPPMMNGAQPMPPAPNGVQPPTNTNTQPNVQAATNTNSTQTANAQQPNRSAQNNQAPQAGAPMPNGQAAMAPTPNGQMHPVMMGDKDKMYDFKPTYLVKAKANGVEYKIVVDAQSGKVVKADIDD